MKFIKNVYEKVKLFYLKWSNKRALVKELDNLEASDPSNKFLKVCQELERRSLKKKHPELILGNVKKTGKSTEYRIAQYKALKFHNVRIGPPKLWTKSNLKLVSKYADKYREEKIEMLNKHINRSKFQEFSDKIKNTIKRIGGKLYGLFN